MSLPDSCRFSSLLRISSQYKYLNTIRKDIHGLYVLPRENDPYTWDGVIFVSSGVWEEGIFKFSLQIPKGDLNASICTLKFVTPLYHPFVNPRTHCLDIQYIYPKWRTDSNVLANLLVKVVEMFHRTSFDVNVCPNTEAAKFFNEHTDAVAKKELLQKIRSCVENSIKTRFDPIPGASLTFGKPEDNDFEEYNLLKERLQIK